MRDGDRGVGPTKATNTGFDGVLTWRFRARNVRDFDWGASQKFLWDATVAVVGDRDRDGRPDTTAINTFYRPEARAWSWNKSGDYERNVVEFLSNGDGLQFHKSHVFLLNESRWDVAVLQPTKSC